LNSFSLSADAQATLDAVTAALSARDRDRAIALSRAALDTGVQHPLFLNLRSFWHEQAGRLAEALRDLEAAHALAPEDVPVLNALGLALARDKRWREALAKFEAAAAREPGFLHAHLNRGWMHERLGDLDQARQAYEIVLAGDPNAVFAAGALASLAARRSDWAAVRTFAAQVLARDPRQVNANYALALAETAEGDVSAAVARLTPFAEDAALHPLSRALMRGALADALHDGGQFDAAFDWYAKAAADLAQAHAADFARPGVETANAYVQRSAIYVVQSQPELTHTPPHSFARLPGKPAVHGFLIGFPRSGTTLLENVFAAHPDVRTSEEKEGFTQAMRRFMMTPSGIEELCRADAASLEPYRRAYWAEIEANGADTGARIFIDKYPLNTLKLPLIARLFPEAKILFALRDPRDVVLSCFRRRFTMNASMYEFTGLERAAQYYDVVMQFALQARRAFDLTIAYTRYEDFVAEFEPRAFEICKFLDIPWTADIPAFAEKARGRAISTPSSTQVARGIYQDGQGQWRPYARHLAPVMPLLTPWIERFGYPLD
jgi:tetratricopeptide (TPR) repeat protein